MHTAARLTTALLLVLLTLKVTSGERIMKNLAQTTSTIEEVADLLSELEADSAVTAD